MLLGLGIFNVSAQTLSQAKELYEKGDYAKAKPVFLKYVKSQPANGNYNLWYGVCCLKTGEADKAVKYLETAVKKRIPSGQLYLSQAYNNVYRFEDAIACYEEYIEALNKRKRTTDAENAGKLLEQTKANYRMLKGVEEVCVIDSFITDKKDFLKAYKISPESGKLFMYNEYFKTNKNAECTVYETELGNKIYYSELQENNTLSILSRNKMLNEWGRGSLLPGDINENANANYPFVMADGVTIYYASDGEGSIGGYDIFVTRYNTTTDTYLTPENVGMPFNSPYNDYMYVIDEFNNLGWFASDRFQPEGKVCIYVFIPNTSKQVYNYEATDPEKIISLALLHSIKNTWIDEEAVTEAQQRLKNIGKGQVATTVNRDFEFIIDDNTVYHKLSDFRSPEAKNKFVEYQQKEKALNQQQKKLDRMRTRYALVRENDKKQLEPAILDLEKRIMQLTEEIDNMAIQIRTIEKKK